MVAPTKGLFVRRRTAPWSPADCPQNKHLDEYLGMSPRCWESLVALHCTPAQDPTRFRRDHRGLIGKAYNKLMLAEPKRAPPLVGIGS